MNAVTLAPKDATEPVALDLAKQHCRIDTTDDDSLIRDIYIPAARQTVEQYTGLTMLAGDVDALVPGTLADTNAIPVPIQPVDTVTALSTVEPSGTEVPLDLDEYGVAVTVFVPGKAQMITTRKQLPYAWAYRVQYATGFENCPPALMLAMLEYVGDAYENRESQQLQYMVYANPRAVGLMDPFRLTFGV